MKSFSIKPRVIQFNKVNEFIEAYDIKDDDLLFITESMFDEFFKGKCNPIVIDYYKYGHGEPSDIAVESIYDTLENKSYNRVFAIGGGTILDVAKLFALKNISPVVDLFLGKLEIKKSHELILVPTTCGTGSEVTNISILELTTIGTKFGLAKEELYANDAVLIPELLKSLPFKPFACSAIDALIHAIESFTSPKANEYTKMYSKEAIKLIIEGFLAIRVMGVEYRNHIIKDFLIASNYAGIAFGNAGCAAVHAMSYPLGAKYHVPHGESNFVMFTAVYKKYMSIDPNGSISDLNKYISNILDCKKTEVYDVLDKLLNGLIKKKSLHEYGVKEEELLEFTEAVMTKQQRLMTNNYVSLTREDVLEIYKKLY